MGIELHEKLQFGHYRFHIPDLALGFGGKGLTRPWFPIEQALERFQSVCIPPFRICDVAKTVGDFPVVFRALGLRGIQV